MRTQLLKALMGAALVFSGQMALAAPGSEALQVLVEWMVKDGVDYHGPQSNPRPFVIYNVKETITVAEGDEVRLTMTISKGAQLAHYYPEADLDLKAKKGMTQTRTSKSGIDVRADKAGFAGLVTYGNLVLQNKPIDQVLDPSAQSGSFKIVTVENQFVHQAKVVYNLLLNRDGDQGGVNAFAQSLRNGSAIAELMSTMLQSWESVNDLPSQIGQSLGTADGVEIARQRLANGFQLITGGRASDEGTQQYELIVVQLARCQQLAQYPNAPMFKNACNTVANRLAAHPDVQAALNATFSLTVTGGGSVPPDIFEIH